MESTNLRHFYHIQRLKIIIVILLITGAGKASGQALNKPFYDYDRFIHFGFTLGFNYSTLKYDFSNTWYHQHPADTIMRVSAQGTTGFSLGIVSDLHLGPPKSFVREHFDLRFIPTLVLTERDLVYTMKDSSIETKKIESAFVQAPFLLKMKSDRFGNIRFYVIGGAEYSFDLSSTAGAAIDPTNPKIALAASNIAYQYGVGLDMYFPYFKFSPEIKISQGINNVLVPQNTIYTNIFSRLRSNFIYFSLYFEG